MSKVLITESILSNIGNAIRSRLGVMTIYKPGEMPAAIMSIPSTHGRKSITRNGTYRAADDGIDGYSEVVVSVEGSGCPRALAVSQINYSELLSTVTWNGMAYEKTE